MTSGSWTLSWVERWPAERAEIGPDWPCLSAYRLKPGELHHSRVRLARGCFVGQDCEGRCRSRGASLLMMILLLCDVLRSQACQRIALPVATAGAAALQPRPGLGRRGCGRRPSSPAKS